MRRSLLVMAVCVCAWTSSIEGGLLSPASALADGRPEVIGQNRIRLFGYWRIYFEHGDDDDFWLVVNRPLPVLQPQIIHVVETLDVTIREDNVIEGWTVDVLVDPTNDTDCGVPASNCPPAYIEFNQISDWKYRLRAEDDPGVEINDTDVIFERLDRPGPVGPALFAVQVDAFHWQFSWSPFPAATSYRLEVGLVPGRTDWVFQLGNIHSLLASGPPGTYFVRLFADWAGGPSGPSNEVQVTLGVCNRLPAPTLLQFTKTGSLVTLMWLGVGGSNGTRLLVSNSPQFVGNLVNMSIGPVSSYQADVSSIPSGTYVVRVAAENGCGMGLPSDYVTITVP